MGGKYFRSKKLTVVQQAYALRALYPESQGTVRRGVLDWTGVLVPTPVSVSYTINVIYRKGWGPKTYVLTPTLELFPGKQLPHVYSHEEQRLCLYYPRSGEEWNESMSIASTIVPWASEWLLFYELWFATGDWLGGGIHIDAKEEDPKKAP